MTVTLTVDTSTLLGLQYLFKRKRWGSYIQLLHDCELISLPRSEFLLEEINRIFSHVPDEVDADLRIVDLLSRRRLTPSGLIPLPAPTIYSAT